MWRNNRDPDLVDFAHSMRRKMTAAEVFVWNIVRRSQMGCRFRRQEPLGGFVVDFVSHSAKLVIEIDGDGHVESWRDRERDAELGRLGYRVLRIWNENLGDEPYIKNVIAEWVSNPDKRS